MPWCSASRRPSSDRTALTIFVAGAAPQPAPSSLGAEDEARARDVAGGGLRRRQDGSEQGALWEPSCELARGPHDLTRRVLGRQQDGAEDVPLSVATVITHDRHPPMPELRSADDADDELVSPEGLLGELQPRPLTHEDSFARTSLPDRSNPGRDPREEVGGPATGTLRSRRRYPTEERRSTVLRLDLDNLARSGAFNGAVNRDRMI